MKKHHSSYLQILKSTGIFGGSQVIGILVGLARTKIIALLLGTTGIGLIGNFQSIIDMIRSIAGLGLDTSGMREVATSEKNDKKAITETVSVLIWWIKVTSFMGLLLCILLAYPISLWIFDSSDYVWQIMLLSFAVLFNMAAISLTVVMQGMRKITYVVKANIYGNILSLILTIPIYFLLGLNGIIAALTIGVVINFVVSYFYYKKLRIAIIKIPTKVALEKGQQMIKFGGYILLGAVSATLGMFLIRSFISQDIGIGEAGLFHAVWTITGVYLALILRSMGSDYYPRLCNVIQKNAAARRLVNEQTYIALILASPIIIGMLIFSKPILMFLYSSEFSDATHLLQWQILGTALKVLSWPMAFIILAKGRGLLFFLSEFFFYVIYLLSSYLLLSHFGLEAAGIGYLIAYVIYVIYIYIQAAWLSHFVWRSDVIVLILVYFSLIFLTFGAMYFMQRPVNYLVAGGALLVATILSALNLNKIVNVRSIFSKKMNHLKFLVFLFLVLFDIRRKN